MVYVIKMITKYLDNDKRFSRASTFSHYPINQQNNESEGLIMAYKINEHGQLELINQSEYLSPEFFSKENIRHGANGMVYYPKELTTDRFIHIVKGNTKTGDEVGNFNLPIEYTCDHRCECYKDKKCYACGGCYNYSTNQVTYTQNYNFIRSDRYDFEDIIKVFSTVIHAENFKLFRYFTCGDIPNKRFFEIMVEIAYQNPTVKFWAYTKKYYIVNEYLKHFDNVLPENLIIVYSHWLNDDGTYFPMDNPYNMPTSEFIPLNKEYLAKLVTHVCPCSDPTVIATCATCDHACYTLKRGESMALLEHSTGRTMKRDREIKAAKKALMN